LLCQFDMNNTNQTLPVPDKQCLRAEQSRPCSHYAN